MTYQVGDVLRLSCEPADARIAAVTRAYVFVDWPWGERDRTSRVRWNGQVALPRDPDSAEWDLTLFRAEPHFAELSVGDVCLVGVPSTVATVVSVSPHDPRREVGWLPKPHTVVGIRREGSSPEAETVFPLYLEPQEPIEIEILRRR